MREVLEKIIQPNVYRRIYYPHNILESDKHIYDDYLNDEVPTIEIRKLGKLCFTYDGVYYKNLKRVIEGSPYYFERNHPESVKSCLETRKARIKRIIKHFILIRKYRVDSRVLVTDYYSYNYYHWFAETLPRICYLAMKNVANTILLPSTYKKYNYIFESLEMFPELNFEFMSDNSKAVIGNTTWVSQAGKPYQFNTPLMQVYKDRASGCYNKTELESTNSLIFINRKKASRRKLINESEVLAMFKRYNFEIIDFEDYPWEKQIEICRHTSVIAGIHGAGLTNVIFCPDRAIVFELQKKTKFASCFFRLSNAIGAEYFTQYSIEAADTTESEVSSDIKMDLSELELNINRITERLNSRKS